MKKRFLSILFWLSAILALSACGRSDHAEPGEPSDFQIRFTSGTTEVTETLGRYNFSWNTTDSTGSGVGVISDFVYPPDDPNLFQTTASAGTTVTFLYDKGVEGYTVTVRAYNDASTEEAQITPDGDSITLEAGMAYVISVDYGESGDADYAFRVAGEATPANTTGEPEESSGSKEEEGASEEPSVDYYEYDGYKIYNDLDEIIDPTEIERYTSPHQLFTLTIPEEYREWLLIGTSLEAGEDEMADGVILLVKPALEKQETLIGGGWGTYAAVIWAVKTDSDQFNVVSQSTDETPVAEVGEYSYFIMEHASEMRAVLGETADTEYANLLAALDAGIDSWVEILQ